MHRLVNELRDAYAQEPTYHMLVRVFQEHFTIDENDLRPRKGKVLFHRTLLDEFFLISIRKKIYKSLEEIQADLDKFMIHYNFNRTHLGYKLNGKTPVSKFLIGIKGPPKLESKT